MDNNQKKCNKEFDRWKKMAVADLELLSELVDMEGDVSRIEDAFYRDLSFGTGGLRGIIGAGTNRMNVYVVAKASQGLANYLLKKYEKPMVIIGYDSRIKSDLFARAAAEVFAANNITVNIWPELTPVPTVSYAIRYLEASAGVMITASHNPSKYNGYKVYGSDGCQITTEAAAEIMSEINALEIFKDVISVDYDDAVKSGVVRCIDSSVLDAYINDVRAQSVSFGDEIDRNVTIVYTPLNGSGLKPVKRVLDDTGFRNIVIVKEQERPDGFFPTCPYPNPEIPEAMALGLEYCKDNKADLLLATDPDADRCGIAVRADDEEYKLLTGNEVGILLLDYICSQRINHGEMPKKPVFIKTIVTTDLAEKIASHYGVQTINVLTGFKFIGEQIGFLEKENREWDYICGFEESYGYLTGAYVRDKDAVNAAFIISEMYAFYKTRGLSLLEKLKDIYNFYGYSMNTLHSFEFPGSSGMDKMRVIMTSFRNGMRTIGEMSVYKTEDYNKGLYGLPASDVLKFYFRGEYESGSIVIRPSGTEPKLKVYISITSENEDTAKEFEDIIINELQSVIYG